MMRIKNIDRREWRLILKRSLALVGRILAVVARPANVGAWVQLARAAAALGREVDEALASAVPMQLESAPPDDIEQEALGVAAMISRAAISGSASDWRQVAKALRHLADRIEEG